MINKTIILNEKFSKNRISMILTIKSELYNKKDKYFCIRREIKQLNYNKAKNIEK